jgi:hypothetical protein
MRTLYSWWLGGAAAVTVLAGALYVGCASLAQPGWSAGPSEVERLERLTTDWESMGRRQEAVRFLVREVAEGRMSLRQAAAHVRAEDVGSPPQLRMHVEYLPGRTEEERYCRSVLRNVGAFLDGDPRAPAVLARLVAELEDIAQGRLGPPPWRTGPARRPPPPLPPELLPPPSAEQAELGEAR